MIHRCIDCIDVLSNALSEVWVATSAESVEAINKIRLLVGIGKWKRRPVNLVRQSLRLIVQRQEAGFDIGVRINSLDAA